MSKLISYILMGLGVVVLALPFIAKSILPAVIKPYYIIIAGLVLLAAGIFFLSQGDSSSSVKHAAPEVPIYKGTGSNRRIIGYRREED